MSGGTGRSCINWHAYATVCVLVVYNSQLGVLRIMPSCLWETDWRLSQAFAWIVTQGARRTELNGAHTWSPVSHLLDQPAAALGLVVHCPGWHACLVAGESGGGILPSHKHEGDRWTMHRFGCCCWVHEALALSYCRTVTA